MSIPPPYNLRSTIGTRNTQSSDSEDDSVLETTIMEKDLIPNAASEQLSAILTGLNALRTSVEELRNTSAESQRDIERLRGQMQTHATTAGEILPMQSRETTTTPSTDHTASEVMPIVQCDSSAKLYDLPTFSGNAAEWPLFVANYKDTTETFKYSNRQNLIRLHKSLVGPAREAVTSMLIYPNDVPKAIEELEFRFGRPDLLVRHQLNMLQQLPCISENKHEQLVSLSTKVRNLVAFLTSAGCQHHLSNPMLLEQMILKLPASKQYEWARHASTIKPYTTIADFAKWLTDLSKVVSLLPQQASTSSKSNTSSHQPRRVMHVKEEVPKKEFKCALCGEGHFVADCKVFTQTLSINDRWKKVKSLHLCFSCLRKGHGAAQCRRRRGCGINGCQRQHHRSLHEERITPSTEQPAAVQSLLNCQISPTTNQLYKILPVVLYGPNGKLDVYAMFDEGSAISLIEENIAKQLGVNGRPQPLQLQWYDQTVTTEKSAKVSLEIAENAEASKFTIKNIRTIRNLNLPVQSFKRTDHKHFEFLPLKDYVNAKPAILLGLDCVHLGVTTTLVRADNSSPVAAKTQLGWVAYGPIKSQSPSCPLILHTQESPKADELHQLVSEYFATDSFGTNDLAKIIESEDDIKARKILHDTTKRIGKQFETGLLWKDYPPIFPNSQQLAESRLMGVERKMKSNPGFAEKYKCEMNKYLEKGYARKLTAEEVADASKPVWYLPHFAVQTPHKPDKLRIVFDAAATVDDRSLNSTLLKGPEQAKPLLGVLLKFRQKEVGVAADIREMFSQIRIRPADQNAQRFVWRDGDTSQPVQHYAMSSMIFGAVCSPCCAEFIKNLNADEFKNRFPEAVSAIIENHYVDDFVCSFSGEETAKQICQQVVNIHAEAGFQLRGFISNCKSLQSSLNGSANARDDPLNMERQAATEKVLGMYWETATDSFTFHTRFHRIPQHVIEGVRPPTKRELLGIIMAVFDPFGLLADFLILPKVLVQETWKCNLHWDETIPAELSKKWFAWWTAFQAVKDFKIQRCYSLHLGESRDVQLHIFVDASQAAFAAVGYFRIAHAKEVDVAFVVGKTRTAPQKTMTIPRLELQAAVLGTRLSHLACQNHEIVISRTVFWSDSRTVLHWIRSSQRKYKPFVSHRIAEILDTTAPSQWRWVPTNLNSADVATRPKFPPVFQLKSQWLSGPEFLKQDEQYWPVEEVQPPLESSEEEVKAALLLQYQASTNVIDINKFSSYLKLKRSLAWVLRAVRLLRRRHCTTNCQQTRGALTVDEINDAEKLLCQMVQRAQYTKEIAALKNHQSIAKESPIYALSPYVDEDGLLRVKGRIDEASYLPFDARRPILLPQKHKLSELIMQHFHQKLHHQDTAAIINEARQRFWFPRAKAVLKAVQRSCQRCRIDSAKPKPPIMGSLPADRVTPYVRPFTYTGVDLFGPFDVSIGRRREKRWAVIFTCLTVRAAHLELAENLSTDAFIVCLRNFINRRGTPTRIRSDNGTNFVGAQRELKEAERLLDTDRIQEEATKRGIEWLFNCPANPSSGGCWERLIRVIKRLLSHTLREVAPKVETLRCVLIEAENIINSRPLTDIPLSCEDDEPLTPNHFLIGCVNSTQTPHPVDTKICLRKQWRIAQNLKDRLWSRWVTEYLPQLLHRTKWHDQTLPLKVNDLVLICDPSRPRSLWPKGRIIKVFPAKDGQIRFAEVKTAHGITRRPTTRLAVLTVDGESPSDPRGEGC